MTTIKRWSFSGLSTYEKCPRAAKYQYIDKVDTKSSPALERGSALHKAAEDFMLHRTDEIPTEFNKLVPWMLELRETPIHVEENWGFTRNWTPTAFDADDCWVRGSLDLLQQLSPTHAHGFDWKSGKRYPPKHIQQEQLYAVFSFCRFPVLETFDFSFVYIDENKPKEQCTTQRQYTRTSALRLQDAFTRRGIRMTSDTEFRPIASKVTCMFCDFKDICEWAVK